MENRKPRHDDPSLYDFMFGMATVAPEEQAWFIDNHTGKHMTRGQIKARTDALAIGLQLHLSLGLPHSFPTASHPGCEIFDVVSLISINSVDFGPVIWASHKLGCTVAPSNATSTPQELQ